MLWWIHCNRCYSTPNGSTNPAQKYFISSCGHLFCDRCNTKNEVELKCGVCSRTPFASSCLDKTLNKNLQKLFKPPAVLFEEAMKKVNGAVAFQRSHNEVVKQQMEAQSERYNQLSKERKTAADENERLTRKVTMLADSEKRHYAVIQEIGQHYTRFVRQVHQLSASKFAGDGVNALRDNGRLRYNGNPDKVLNAELVGRKASESNSWGVDQTSSSTDSLFALTTDQGRIPVPGSRNTSASLSDVITLSPNHALSQTTNLTTPQILGISDEANSSADRNLRKNNPYMELWCKKSGASQRCSQDQSVSPLSGASWPRVTLGVGHKNRSPASIHSVSSLGRKSGEFHGPLDYKFKPPFTKHSKPKGVPRV